MTEVKDQVSPLAAAIEELAGEIPLELEGLAKAIASTDLAAAESAWESILAEILDEG
jgi:hypothetical protein